MAEKLRFQVNLRGIIDLLAKHLYSSPQVFIRELLQNAVDAITARSLIQPEHRGEITLEIAPASRERPATLIFTDNGVGLTEEEVHRFLATIGESSKRLSDDQRSFLGQFGIGLLSAFGVSEEIVVITRSIHGDNPPLEWRGNANGSYSLRTLDVEIAAGTQVYLRAKPGCGDYFDPRFVRDAARQFGSLLPFPIQVVVGNDRTRINREPPWRSAYSSRDSERAAYLEYGQREFDTDFLDAFPIQSTVGGVEGIAFVLPIAVGLAGSQAHRAYLKNMLLSEQATNLLPNWAFFVKCVVNVTDLKPTASREAFYEDEWLDAARDSLGACIRNYLLELANYDRPRMDRLIEVHHLPIKALAREDDDVFRLFIDWLPFETSVGRLTLAELPRDSAVKYVVGRDQFRQIASVAAASGQCILNAEYIYDAELLARLQKLFPDRHIEKIDVADLSQMFDDLTLDERDVAFDLLKLADCVLQPFVCSAEIKKFKPSQLPALYVGSDSTSFGRSLEQARELSDSLWANVLDSLANQERPDRPARLCLNFDNPLIRQLTTLADRELGRRALEMLYVQALLMGHYPLRAKEVAAFNQGLIAMLESSLQRPPTELAPDGA
jgi:molecular chaperone HtpG